MKRVSDVVTFHTEVSTGDPVECVMNILLQWQSSPKTQEGHTTP